MYQFLGTRTILVSTNIPHELQTVPATKVSKQSLISYLDLTKRDISFVPWSDLDAMKYRTLVMANTRRKAANIFQNMKTKFVDTMYLSSGIRKKGKIKILAELHRKEKFILVSTQVVEAGVDIIFSHVFREKAPLDSIIQVIGRLNREAENDNARLVVYEYDNEHKTIQQTRIK